MQRELYRGTDALMILSGNKEMDSFTKRYLYLLGALILAGALWWILNLDFRVGELNDLLEADETLADYPYTFKVLSLENGVASMSSPRSAKMSAIQGLRIMFPELENASAVSAEMMAAQKQLASTQSRAGKLIGEQEDVRRVLWVLDERWLASHGVYVQ